MNKKDFLRKLKALSAYKQFKIYNKNYEWDKFRNFETIIRYSFDWRFTTEGCDFWYFISKN